MDMRSSPLDAPGSSDSLNGLKFGKKIYFEDVGSCQSCSSSSSSGAKKGRGTCQGGGGQQQQQQPPRCQVEGCGEDLTGEKAYYCSHKVCIMHSKSPKVVVAGLEQRFCQQCSRFHQLPEFDQGKRSCRRRLAGHNERRRKPPPMPFPSRYGQFPSSFHGHFLVHIPSPSLLLEDIFCMMIIYMLIICLDDGSRYGSLVMDLAHPGLQGTARQAWPNFRSSEHVTVAHWPITANTSSGRAGVTQPHPSSHSSAAGMLFSNRDIPPDECLNGSHSSCALSLLSNQSWGTAALNVRAPIMQTNHFHGNHSTAQPTIPNNIGSNAWGFKGNEVCGTMPEPPIQICMDQDAEPTVGRGQFPCELELALQGSSRRVEGHEQDYFPSGSQMHWSR